MNLYFNLCVYVFIYAYMVSIYAIWIFFFEINYFINCCTADQCVLVETDFLLYALHIFESICSNIERCVCVCVCACVCMRFAVSTRIQINFFTFEWSFISYFKFEH
jgi:hypothetical protein